MTDFEAYRQKRHEGNDKVMNSDNLNIKRFFSLDSAAYRDGALPAETKELLGLVASMVLRCNDCIDYHLEQCVGAGHGRKELEEAMNVALLVGGSIVIPHMRHAFGSLDFLLAEKQAGEGS